MSDTSAVRLAFWEYFVAELTDRHASGRSNFLARYNNTAPKRVPNARPRTDLMLKDTDSVVHSLVARMKDSGMLEASGEVSPARFMDLLYFSGNWWAGERIADLAVEVENEWSELRGTLRDLYQFQARVKVAIVYHNSPPNSIVEVEDSVASVNRSFTSAGFAESPDTAYLVIVAPTRLEPQSGHVAGYFFDGSGASPSGQWQHTFLAPGLTA